MEGFSFVTPVTGINRRNTGKEDDDDDMLYISFPFFYHFDTYIFFIRTSKSYLMVAALVE
jgi:hypothetical protein